MNINQKRSTALKIYWQNAVERKIQMSKIMKEGNNPAKSIAARKKISESKQGKHFKRNNLLSEKQKSHLLRLAESKKGKSLSLQTCMKISLSRKGKCKGAENPFYGKHHKKAGIKAMKISRKLNRERHFQNIFKKAKDYGFDLKALLRQDGRKSILQKHHTVDPLGYIIGTIPTDAYFDKIVKRNTYRYSISVKDKDFVECVANCFKENCGFKPKLYPQRNLLRIQTSKKQIKQFLKFLEKEGVNQWIFNKKVFKSNRNFHRSILRAVSDAEGCITNANSKGKVISRRVTITNSSLTLLKQIRLLLESFEIRSCIYHHRGPRITEIHGEIYKFKKHVFVLVITGYQDLQKFKDTIGFSIKRKQHKLENVIASYKKIERRYTPNEYKLVLKLSKYFFNCSDISRLTKISSHTVRNWVLYDKKPRSTKMVELA